ncbi:hypothetical protein Jab_1c05780 [Janthinobacterium sp. HH01]|uniref:hypothetical protein n=1 Tax=Janthinobacterium sp. HH01 TaxID=1198452 RepID=UPI0002AE8F08|nr:hypothetical protein [Janthinobacterium sp. HH01]ELX11989.1 hypothetical protein Jab_1c05780 [Janthinobacterium sp. HH01]
MHATSVSTLASLRADIDSLIIRMKINAGFSITEFEEKLLALRERYKPNPPPLPPK